MKVRSRLGGCMLRNRALPGTMSTFGRVIFCGCPMWPHELERLQALLELITHLAAPDTCIHIHPWCLRRETLRIDDCSSSAM